MRSQWMDPNPPHHPHPHQHQYPHPHPHPHQHQHPHPHQQQHPPPQPLFTSRIAPSDHFHNPHGRQQRLPPPARGPPPPPSHSHYTHGSAPIPPQQHSYHGSHSQQAPARQVGNQSMQQQRIGPGPSDNKQHPNDPYTSIAPTMSMPPSHMGGAVAPPPPHQFRGDRRHSSLGQNQGQRGGGPLRNQRPHHNFHHHHHPTTAGSHTDDHNHRNPPPRPRNPQGPPPLGESRIHNIQMITPSKQSNSNTQALTKSAAIIPSRTLSNLTSSKYSGSDSGSNNSNENDNDNRSNDSTSRSSRNPSPIPLAPLLSFTQRRPNTFERPDLENAVSILLGMKSYLLSPKEEETTSPTTNSSTQAQTNHRDGIATPTTVENAKINFSYPTRLALQEDSCKLNSMHCYLRSELLELFVLETTKDPSGNALNPIDNTSPQKDDAGENYYGSNNATAHPMISPNTTLFVASPALSSLPSSGRVGLRCVYCALARKCKASKHSNISTCSDNCDDSSNGDDVDTNANAAAATPSVSEAPMAVFYPKSISELYRLVTSWQRVHLRKCKNLPPSVRDTYLEIKESDKTRGKTQYWTTSATKLGLINCTSKAGGLRFSAPASSFPSNEYVPCTITPISPASPAAVSMTTSTD